MLQALLSSGIRKCQKRMLPGNLRRLLFAGELEKEPTLPLGLAIRPRKSARPDDLLRPAAE